MMYECFPGDAIRFMNSVTVLGVLTSTALAFEIRSQDGSVVIAGTVVRDVDGTTGLALVGANYCDVLVPSTAPPGIWQEVWQATGIPIDANRYLARPFRVKRLPL
jgi:hypothetical protein